MLQIGKFFSQRVLLVFLRQKNIVFTSLDFIHSFNLILIFFNLLSPIVSLFITAAHGVKKPFKKPSLSEIIMFLDGKPVV